ncbi:MAG TPA: hypothetical protein VGR43_09490 [Dehalococcoidia bacterium]|nr:hypothetical protein [Dehalococcoidia bacterium]
MLVIRFATILVVNANSSTSVALRVLLVGGGAAVGKSTVAARIARRFRAALVPTDFLWLALQAVTDAGTNPELHNFDENNLDLSLEPDHLFEKHIQTAITYAIHLNLS